MTSPPAKRPRTEDTITRSEFWHSDGSVVLQAQKTQSRVHWSVLARNSSFFRDMQSLPQPPNQPTVEGCPVVELPDDAVDVEWILKALYLPPFLGQPALPFAAVAAHIRLGRKYDFRELLDLALARLNFEHPTTLYGYDALLLDRPTRIVATPSLSLDILALARENDILSVLPLAYYRVLLRGSSADSLFETIKRADGTEASLAAIDLRRCVSGREKIINAQLQPGYSRGWLRSYSPGTQCASPVGCTAWRDSLLRTYLDAPALDAFWRLSYFDQTFCFACKRELSEANAGGRILMWEELPSFFGLPNWSELKNVL